MPSETGLKAPALVPCGFAAKAGREGPLGERFRAGAAAGGGGEDDLVPSGVAGGLPDHGVNSRSPACWGRRSAGC